MKKIAVLILSASLFMGACSTPEHQSLDAGTFIEHVTSGNDEIQVVDARTKQEFEKFHIKGAVNIDIQNEDWKSKLSNLKKSQPVYIYCLSGARSADMMAVLKEEGFKQVYNMEGGIAPLSQQQLALLSGGTGTASDTHSSGAQMTKADFEQFIAENKNVVVDFYADWCGPCKAMNPHLVKLAEEHKEKFVLYKVNFDQSRELAQSMGVKGIPHLFIYKDGQLVDQSVGFHPKMVEQLMEKILKPFL